MKKYLFVFIVYFIFQPVYATIKVDPASQKTITAEKIEYNLKTGNITTIGHTEIMNQSGQRMTLKDVYLSQSDNKITADNIQLWLGAHEYVQAYEIEKEGNLTIAEHSMFTACYDCDKLGNAWEISAQKITHNTDTKMLRFYNPVLWVYKIPVFWSPFYAMPDPSVKYKTGFLMPNFESTNNMGSQINIPFYIAIAKNHDLTLTSSILTKEHPMFQIEHRLNEEHSIYRTRGAYTYNKNNEHRWFIYNNDIIELGNYARSSLFLERVSDKTFLQKYGFYDDRPYLDSGAKLELFGQSSYVVADAHIFQELRTSTGIQTAPDGNILPNIRGVYQTAPFYHETYALFSTDILGISNDDNSTQRLIGDARIISPWTLPFGNRLILSLDTRYDIYNFNNTESEQNLEGIKNRFLPSGYIEWGFPLFNTTKNWIHVIEPKARLTIMKKTNDESVYSSTNDSAGTFLSDSVLFSDNRFSGLDVWENGTFADYGIRWNTFNNNGQNLELFLGQSYDFTDIDQLDINSGFHKKQSDYVGRFVYDNDEWFNIASRFRFDKNTFGLHHIETTGTFKHFGINLYLGHIWSQQLDELLSTTATINELSSGAGINLTDRWSIQFNSIYNETFKEFQRHSGGIFYNHPCYYLSLEYKHDNAIKEDYVGNTTYQFRFGMSIDGKHY